MSTRQVTSPIGIVQLVLREIRLEHTLFALPFAYVGAVFAAHGLPTLYQFCWISLAVLGARTAAMATNRYIDRDIDARNPRTARRALATGALAPGVMLGVAVAGIILLAVSAAALGPLCIRLLPLAALGIFAYPFCKRFTWAVHFVLGAVDGCAPLGAYIAVSGRISLSAVLLFVAVTIWVAGFDVIYALMDRDVDVAQNIRSIPAHFGTSKGRQLPIVLHVVLGLCLIAAGALESLGPLYYVGALLAFVLAAYEQLQFDRAENVFVLNERVFMANMIFSVAFLVATYCGFAVRWW
jgi:4-hydroxybenzoate polyprenyltransferase